MVPPRLGLVSGLALGLLWTVGRRGVWLEHRRCLFVLARMVARLVARMARVVAKTAAEMAMCAAVAQAIAAAQAWQQMSPTARSQASRC